MGHVSGELTLAHTVMLYGAVVVFSRLCTETEVPLLCKQPLALFDPFLWKISGSLGSES